MMLMLIYLIFSLSLNTGLSQCEPQPGNVVRGTDALNDWLKGRMCELGYVRLKEVETSAGRSIYLWLTPARSEACRIPILPIGVLPNGNTQML